MSRAALVLLLVTVAASLAPRPAVAAADAVIDACALLSSEDAAAVLGRAVERGARHDEGRQPGGEYSSSCLWRAVAAEAADGDATDAHAFVIVNAFRWPRGTRGPGTFLDAFRTAAARGEIPRAPEPRSLGDESLWWGDGLAVRRGDVSFGVSVVGSSPGVPRDGRLEERLARHILERLATLPSPSSASPRLTESRP